MDMIGRIVGNYRLASLIGEGGLGQVYLAHHTHLERTAAVKLLHPGLSAIAANQRMFLREARAVEKLTHDNIIKMIDFGESDHQLYLVMEYVDGGSIGTLMLERGLGRPLHLSLALELMSQAARGLEHAHQRGVIHRDIKPQNLLLQRRQPAASRTSGYVVKIADFGLARLTSGESTTTISATAGTPKYMSPEQCQGIEADARSDLYSLGVVIYQATTGEVPFEIRSIVEAIDKHVNVAPIPPTRYQSQLPAAVEAIILRCLEKRPEDRFATAAELADAIDAARMEIADRVDDLSDDDSDTQMGWTPPLSILPWKGSLNLVVGVPAVAAVTIVNLGSKPERVELSLEGIPRAWASFDTDVVEVEPGRHAVASITFHVDTLDAGAAGAFPITLRARSKGPAERVAEASAELIVAHRDELQLSLDQARVTVIAGQVARLAGEVINLGSRPVQVEMSVDAAPGRWFSFSPTPLRIEIAKSGRFAAEIAVDPADCPHLTVRELVASARALGPASARAEAPFLVTVRHVRLQVALADDPVRLRPGQPTRVRLILANLDDQAAEVELCLEGAPPGRVTLPPSPVRVDAGGKLEGTIEIVPNSTGEPATRSFPVTLIARTLGETAEQAVAHGIWDVLPAPKLEIALDDNPLEISVGRSTRAMVTVANLGGEPVSVMLSVEGHPDGSLRLPDGPVAIAPGTRIQGTMELTVAAPGCSPGAYPVTVRVRSVDDPALGAEVVGEWRVLPFHDYHARIEPERSTAHDETELSVVIENRGNTPARYSVRADASPAGPDVQLPIDTIIVQPGSVDRLPVKIQLASGGAKTALSHEVRVEITADDGRHETATAYVDQIRSRSTRKVAITVAAIMLVLILALTIAVLARP